MSWLLDIACKKKKKRRMPPVYLSKYTNSSSSIIRSSLNYYLIFSLLKTITSGNFIICYVDCFFVFFIYNKLEETVELALICINLYILSWNVNVERETTANFRNKRLHRGMREKTTKEEEEEYRRGQASAV